MGNWLNNTWSNRLSLPQFSLLSSVPLGHYLHVSCPRLCVRGKLSSQMPQAVAAIYCRASEEEAGDFREGPQWSRMFQAFIKAYSPAQASCNWARLSWEQIMSCPKNNLTSSVRCRKQEKESEKWGSFSLEKRKTKRLITDFLKIKGWFHSYLT